MENIKNQGTELETPTSIQQISGILRDRSKSKGQEADRRNTMGVVWKDEDEEEKEALVRAALSRQEYAKSRTILGSNTAFNDQTLGVEHFASDESQDRANGAQFNSPKIKGASRNRNISIEEYRRKSQQMKKNKQSNRSHSSANSRQFDVLDYMRAGSEDINRTRGAEMSAQDFDWNQYQKLPPKLAREYLHKLRVQNEKFARHFRRKQGYFYRLFLRKREIAKQREPFEVKVNKKAQRRKRLVEDGIDLQEDDAISAWSELDLDQEHRREVLLTEHQAAVAKLPSAGAISNDPNWVEPTKNRKSSLPEKSQVPNINDPDFASVSGLIQTKTIKTQTVNHYKLVPEMVMFNLETQLKQMIYSLQKPIDDRQQAQFDEIENLRLQLALQKEEISDLQVAMTRSQSMKAEFDALHDALGITTEQFGQLDHKLTEAVREVSTKNEKNQNQLRVIQTDIKSISKFMDKRSDDNQRMQLVLSQYKDRIAENFRRMTDEFTEDLKKLEYRFIQMSETVSQNKRSVAALTNNSIQAQADIVKINDKFIDLKKWQKEMDVVLTYEPRIELLENQAKSDLLSVTAKLEQVRREAEHHIKRVDAFKMCYGLQVDMMKAVLNPKTHRPGLPPTHQNPKRDTEVQSLLNLFDWQKQIAVENHFRDDADRLIEDYKIDYEQLFEPKKIRKNKLTVELNSKVYGKKQFRGTKRSDSCRTQLYPIELQPALKRKNLSVKIHDRVLQRRVTLKVAQNIQERRFFEQNKHREYHDPESKSFTFIPHKVRTIDNLIDVYENPNLLDKLGYTTVGSGGLKQQEFQMPPRAFGSNTNVHQEPVQKPKQKQRTHKIPKKTSKQQVKTKKVPEPSQSSQHTNQIPQTPPEKTQTPIAQPQSDIASPVTAAIRSEVTSNQSQITSDQAPTQQTAQIPETPLQKKKTAVQFAEQIEESVEEVPVKGQIVRPHSNSSDSVESKLFTSEEEEPEVVFDPEILNDYVLREDFDQAMAFIQKEMRFDIMQQTGKLIDQMANEISHKHVQESQVKLLNLMQTQLDDATMKMQDNVFQKTNNLQLSMDRLREKTLPHMKEQIDTALKSCETRIDEALIDLRKSCAQQIAKFGDRVETFEIRTDSLSNKFRRLVSDMHLFKKSIKVSTDKVEDVAKVMRAEQLAQTKVLSTLVELEYIQQSLDFQDEFDKTQMHLWGLHDLDLTLEEFIAKHTGHAALKTQRLKRLQKRSTESPEPTTEVQSENINSSTSEKPFEPNKAGGRNFIEPDVQALVISDTCLKGVSNDNLRKQIHSAFKMACVYYRPSPVLYRGYKYDRRKLIEAKRQMLDNEWELMLSFQPFKRLFGENPSHKFYEQFNHKLHFLTTGSMKRMGQEIKDAFVKITAGNFLDIKSLKTHVEPEEMASMNESFNDPHILQQRMTHDDSRLHKISEDNTRVSSLKHAIDSSIDINLETSFSTGPKLSPRDFKSQPKISNKSSAKNLGAIASSVDKKTQLLNRKRHEDSIYSELDTDMFSSGRNLNYLQLNAVNGTQLQSTQALNQPTQSMLPDLFNHNQSHIIHERSHEPMNRSRSGQQSMQHLFKGGAKQSEKQLLGAIGQVGRHSSRQLHTKSYDKGQTKFLNNLDPMIHSRPLIGRDQTAGKIDNMPNLTSPHSGAQFSLFKERDFINPSPWRKSMLSPANSHQYASVQNLQINAKQKNNVDLDMNEARQKVNVKFPVALQQQSLQMAYQKKLILQNKTLESNITENRQAIAAPKMISQIQLQQLPENVSNQISPQKQTLPIETQEQAFNRFTLEGGTSLNTDSLRLLINEKSAASLHSGSDRDGGMEGQNMQAKMQMSSSPTIQEHLTSSESNNNASSSMSQLQKLKDIASKRQSQKD